MSFYHRRKWDSVLSPSYPSLSSYQSFNPPTSRLVSSISTTDQHVIRTFRMSSRGHLEMSSPTLTNFLVPVHWTVGKTGTWVRSLPVLFVCILIHSDNVTKGTKSGGNNYSVSRVGKDTTIFTRTKSVLQILLPHLTIGFEPPSNSQFHKRQQLQTSFPNPELVRTKTEPRKKEPVFSHGENFDLCCFNTKRDLRIKILKDPVF